MHENYSLLGDYSKYPISKWNGGNVQFVTPHIIHLMRCQVFTIDEDYKQGLQYKFFTMGGASSHDKEFRTEGKSWWKEELPSNKEYEEAIENLIKNNNKVDFIITHCASDFTMGQICPWYIHDKLTNFLESIVESNVEYRHWFFGHYHKDKEIDTKHTALYNKIVRLENYL